MAANADRQLVDLVRAGREARLEHQQVQLRVLLAQRDRVEHVEVRDVAGLGGEPALRDDPVVQRLLVEQARDHASSPLTSWNQ